MTVIKNNFICQIWLAGCSLPTSAIKFQIDHYKVTANILLYISYTSFISFFKEPAFEFQLNMVDELLFIFANS